MQSWVSIFLCVCFHRNIIHHESECYIMLFYFFSIYLVIFFFKIKLSCIQLKLHVNSVKA